MTYAEELAAAINKRSRSMFELGFVEGVQYVMSRLSDADVALALAGEDVAAAAAQGYSEAMAETDGLVGLEWRV